MPRAVRRAATDPKLPLEPLLTQAGELLDAVALLPLDRDLLLAGGALAEPALRALDVLHVAAALAAFPDRRLRQPRRTSERGARLAGLRALAPAGDLERLTVPEVQARPRRADCRRVDRRGRHFAFDGTFDQQSPAAGAPAHPRRLDMDVRSGQYPYQ